MFQLPFGWLSVPQLSPQVSDDQTPKGGPISKEGANCVKVSIKSFDVGMEVKSNGIEFEVRSPDSATQLGDCYLTMTSLSWFNGKTSKAKDIKVTWAEFMAICVANTSLTAAIKAAKAA